MPDYTPFDTESVPNPTSTKETKEYPKHQAMNLATFQVENELRFHKNFLESKGWNESEGCPTLQLDYKSIYGRAARICMLGCIHEWVKDADDDDDDKGDNEDTTIKKLSHQILAVLIKACKQLEVSEADRKAAEEQVKKELVDKDDPHFSVFEERWNRVLST